MGYTLRLKRKNIKMEKMFDRLIANPYVIIKDQKMVQSLGVYGRPLRQKGILHISPDKKLNESVALLKYNNYREPNSVQKKKGRNLLYIFKGNLPDNPI